MTHAPGRPRCMDHKGSAANREVGWKVRRRLMGGRDGTGTGWTVQGSAGHVRGDPMGAALVSGPHQRQRPRLHAGVCRHGRGPGALCPVAMVGAHMGLMLRQHQSGEVASCRFAPPVRCELSAEREGGSEPGGVKRTKGAQAFPPWTPSCRSFSTTATAGASKPRRSGRGRRLQRRAARGRSKPPAPRRHARPKTRNDGQTQQTSARRLRSERKADMLNRASDRCQRRHGAS